jgi:hypothetical protein
MANVLNMMTHFTFCLSSRLICICSKQFCEGSPPHMKSAAEVSNLRTSKELGKCCAVEMISVATHTGHITPGALVSNSWRTQGFVEVLCNRSFE